MSQRHQAEEGKESQEVFYREAASAEAPGLACLCERQQPLWLEGMGSDRSGNYSPQLLPEDLTWGIHLLDTYSTCAMKSAPPLQTSSIWSGSPISEGVVALGRLCPI